MAILDIRIQSLCLKNMMKLRMKLRDKSNDNKMREFSAIKTEAGRKCENGCNRGVNSGTNIDIQIRALESDPQNTFNLNSASDRRNVTARENRMFPIVVIHPSVMQTTVEVTQPEMIVTIQNLFGTNPVLLSNQDAYAKKARHRTMGNCSAIPEINLANHISQFRKKVFETHQGRRTFL